MVIDKWQTGKTKTTIEMVAGTIEITDEDGVFSETITITQDEIPRIRAALDKAEAWSKEQEEADG